MTLAAPATRVKRRTAGFCRSCGARVHNRCTVETPGATVMQSNADLDPARPAHPPRRGPARRLLRAWLRLFGHFRDFHSYGSPRLMYIGWVGAFAYFAMYLLRFTPMHPNYPANPGPVDDLALRALMFVMLLAQGLHRHWPPRLLAWYIPFAYVTLILALPFFATYQGLVRGGGMSAVSNCLLSMAVLTLLVDWRNQIATLLIGVCAAVLMFKLQYPGQPIAGDMIRLIPSLLVILLGSHAFKHSTEFVERERKLLAQQQDNERRLAALSDTLAFLAHELNTPLAAIRGNTTILKQRHPGEAAALDRTERAALYCQNLVSAFVQSARQAHPGAVGPRVTASELVAALLNEYPLEERERASIRVRIEQDFALTGRRDLLYLVFCTLTRNALQAMRAVAQPRLAIAAGVAPAGEGGQAGRGWIRFTDNGSGIPPQLLQKLAVVPVTTRAAEGGSGMGLLFCRRVMESAGGSLRVESQPGAGTTVTLEFDQNRAPA